mgnify:CR=1 FL=1
MCYPTVFPLFCFMFEGIFKYKVLVAYFRKRDLTEVFLRTSSEERWLGFGGTYFRNITVFTPRNFSIKKSIWLKFQP